MKCQNDPDIFTLGGSKKTMVSCNLSLVVFTALSRMASRQNGVRDKTSHSRKQQTARSHNVHWWLCHQRPVMVGLIHCQARCDHHPWRQCSLYGLNLQLDNGGRSSHPCPPLDCLKRWQSDHTCHHPGRFYELATKCDKPILAWVNVSTSTLINSCGCTSLNMAEWREVIEHIDWREKQRAQVACVSEDLKCWWAWNTTCGHKAKDITPSTAWRREAWKEEVLGDLLWKDEGGPSSIRWTLELFQRQFWGSFWEMGWSAYGLFR